MPNTYEVESVSPETRRYEANGPKVAYKVRFKDLSDVVEWSKKDDSPAPKVGEQVEGTIDFSGRFGPKFKRHFAQGGSSSTGGGSVRNDREFGWQTNPVDAARMGRAHAQEMALRFALIHPGAGKAMIDKSGRETLDSVIKPIIDWFQRDVTAGQELAKADAETKVAYGTVKDTVRTGESDVPASLSDFAQQAVPTDDLPF